MDHIRRLLLRAGIVSPVLLNYACSNDEGAEENSFLAPKKLQCVLTPVLEEGSHYVTGVPLRNDIREGRPGVFVHYKFRVVNLNDNCRPVPYAVVDIWQADAKGKYSNGKKSEYFMRGIQNTNQFGEAQFISVFPGWELEVNNGPVKARTNLVHLKIHVNNKVVLTTLFGFSNEVINSVYQHKAYSNLEKKRLTVDGKLYSIERLQNNEEDRLWTDQSEAIPLMPLATTKQGYGGELVIALKL